MRLHPASNYALFKQWHVVAAGAAGLCFFKGEFAHCAKKLVSLCLLWSVGKRVAGADPGYGFVCLRSTWQSEGKPEPQKGHYGPRDAANRKLIRTIAHLPNIHCLEMSVYDVFFHGNVSFCLTSL